MLRSGNLCGGGGGCGEKFGENVWIAIFLGERGRSEDIAKGGSCDKLIFSLF